MLNNISIMGFVVAPPKATTTKTGDEASVVRISQNVRDSESLFIDCLCFKSTASFCNTYLRKGDVVCVVGRLDSDTFTRKDGSQGRTYKIVANTIDRVREKAPDKVPDEVDMDDLPF